MDGIDDHNDEDPKDWSDLEDPEEPFASPEEAGVNMVEFSHLGYSIMAPEGTPERSNTH